MKVALLFALATLGCGGRPLPDAPDEIVVTCVGHEVATDLCAVCRENGSDLAALCPDSASACAAPLPDGCAVQVCAECP